MSSAPSTVDTRDAVLPRAVGAPRTAVLGMVVAACWVLHAQYLLRTGQAVSLLWICHVGTALVAAGLFTRRPHVNAVGVFMLFAGNVCWAIDLAWGGASDWTTLFPHVGGLVVGLVGLRRLGLPRATPLYAVAAMLALLVLSRFATPPAENVNLAFEIHPSARGLFRSHAAYLAVLLVVISAYFLAIEALLRRLGFACPPTIRSRKP